MVEEVGTYREPSELELLEVLNEIDQAGEQRDNTSTLHGERSKEARDRELEALWRRKARHIPDQLSRLFERVRVPDYRLIALEAFESRFFGWSERTSCNGDGSALDAASVRIVYNRLCRGPDAPKALLLAGRIVDAELRTRHHLALEEPTSEPGTRLSGVARGPLRVRDTGYRKPSIGLRSFLEVTPIEVVAHALQVIDTRVATSQSDRPLRVWDLTAGSGTVVDYLRTRNARVVATDLATASGESRFLDLRDAIRNEYHTLPATSRTAGIYSVDRDRVVQAPDLVFLDPPSRGTPSHSLLYTGIDDPRDLAHTTRPQWIEVVASTVLACLPKLGSGGLISLVVREGTRRGQYIEPEPGIPEEVLSRLGEAIVLVERKRIFGYRRVRQASLDKCRLPAVHLLLGRSETTETRT